MRSSRRGFSLVELMLVVGITSLLAAIAIPRMDIMQKRAKRAELQMVLTGLGDWEFGYNAANDGWLTATWNPSYPPNKTQRDFDPARWGWDALDYRPDGRVRGVYWPFTYTSDTMYLYAYSDIDGDSNEAIFGYFVHADGSQHEYYDFYPRRF